MEKIDGNSNKKGVEKNGKTQKTMVTKVYIHFVFFY